MFTWVERDDREIRERGDQKINNLKLIDNAGDGSKKKKKRVTKMLHLSNLPIISIHRIYIIMLLCLREKWTSINRKT